MRGKSIIAVLALCTAGLLTGCGKEKITMADMKNVEVEKYVTLPNYKAMGVTKPQKLEITDADVEEYTREKIDAVKEMHELTGIVQNGDVVNIDYAGTIDGTAFEGGTAQSQFLKIGSGSFIDGFEDGLIGVKVGETKELDLKFPDPYINPDLAGKECIFGVTVNYILTPLNDDNVALVDPAYSSAAAYMEDARQVLVDYVDYRYETELRNYIASALIQACTFKEIPQTLTDDYKQMVRKNLEDAAASAGMTLEGYMSGYYGAAGDEIETEIDNIALRCAKEGIAIQGIANKEGLNVSDEELDAMLSEWAKADGASSVEEYLGEDIDREEVRYSILYSKVYEYLIELYK